MVRVTGEGNSLFHYPSDEQREVYTGADGPVIPRYSVMAEGIPTNLIERQVLQKDQVVPQLPSAFLPHSPLAVSNEDTIHHSVVDEQPSRTMVTKNVSGSNTRAPHS